MNYPIRQFLEKGNKITLKDNWAEFSTDFKSWRIPLDFIFTKDYYEIKFLEVFTTSLENKSQEEIAAEEAVRKAQESLKAAEDVLNKVKKEN